MDHGVQSPQLAGLRQLLRLGHIAFEHLRRADFRAQFLHCLSQSLALISEDDLRALSPISLRNRIRQTPLIRDAQDERGFSFQ